MGFVLLAITALMTLHIGSRALVLTGALLAVIVAVKCWSITPEAERSNPLAGSPEEPRDVTLIKGDVVSEAEAAH